MALHLQASLKLHTQIGEKIFLGIDTHAGKLGLKAYARHLKRLTAAKLAGDSKAAIQLNAIEAALTKLREDIEATQHNVNTACVQDELEIGTTENPCPVTYKLSFAVPLAWQTARVLGQFDTLVRQCFAMKCLGIRLNSEVTITKAFYQLFSMAVFWRQGKKYQRREKIAA